MNTFNHIFTTLDFFSFPISLSFKKQLYYKTCIGGFMSLISVIVLIIICLVFIKDLFDKDTFSIIHNTYIDLSSTLDFSNIPVLFSLVTTSGDVIEPDKNLYTFNVIDFTFSNVLIDGISKTQMEQRQVEFVRCDEMKNNLLEHYFSTFNLSSYYCIKPGQNLALNGRFPDMTNGFKGFRIYVKRCELKKNPNCYDDKYINDVLTDSKLRFSYLLHKIDHYSKNDSIVSLETRTDMVSFSTDLQKKFHYFFSEGHYYVDKNLLWSNNVVDYPFYKYSSTLYAVDTNYINSDNYTSTLGYVGFYSDTNVETYYKNYQKLSATISNIGGFINIVLSISAFISNYLTKNVFIIDLINSLSSQDDSKTIKNPYKHHVVRFNVSNENTTVKKSKSQNMINNSSVSILQGIEETKKTEVKEKEKKNLKKASEYHELHFYHYIIPFALLRTNHNFYWMNKMLNSIYLYIGIENVYLNAKTVLTKQKKNLDNERKSVDNTIDCNILLKPTNSFRPKQSNNKMLLGFSRKNDSIENSINIKKGT